MFKFSPLKSAFGFSNRAALDAAENLNLSWSRVAVQKTMAILNSWHQGFRGYYGRLMLGSSASQSFRNVARVARGYAGGHGPQPR